MMGNDWSGWAGGGLWMLGALVLVIAAIVIVIWMVTRTSRTGETPTQGPSAPTPNQILSERFARGEITEDEYKRARDALGPDQ